MSGSLVSKCDSQRGNYTIFMFPTSPPTTTDTNLTPGPYVLIQLTGTLHSSAAIKTNSAISVPPSPTSITAASLSYLSQSLLSPFLCNPHLFFHFPDSLSFGQPGSMIVASAREEELNAIITPMAIINSVSNGDGERTVDCWGVLRDHVRGLCLFLSLHTCLLTILQAVLLSASFHWGCRNWNSIHHKGHGAWVACWEASKYINC